ncbi:uridylate kinase [Kosmotoga arenicorallina S304]|uniref:Uridylate kinase n=1 Tax=Kosmotoga arenicorallina S304 TaxID=1453497 RepID=A0A176K386_9BACT|nr:UMP kinase [Kosmotoga arenicorallina]OAA31775.1 uridylate kinase [Kosmotoga arenicorallina S304]
MYKRVLLKLSGEVLSGEGNKGFAKEKIDYLIGELKSVVEHGIELGIVIGAGNLFRGVELSSLSSKSADQIGMLGTLINSIYLKEALTNSGIKAVAISSSVNSPSFEPHQYNLIERYFSTNHVVIFGGGTTLPFFTTDTAAAIRAIEISADVLIKATKVDGVYDKDPKLYPKATRIGKITFSEAIEKGLKIMDKEAFSLCQRYKKPVIVINFFIPNSLLSAIIGEKTGTLVLPD